MMFSSCWIKVLMPFSLYYQRCIKQLKQTNCQCKENSFSCQINFHYCNILWNNTHNFMRNILFSFNTTIFSNSAHKMKSKCILNAKKQAAVRLSNVTCTTSPRRRFANCRFRKVKNQKGEKSEKSRVPFLKIKIRMFFKKWERTENIQMKIGRLILVQKINCKMISWISQCSKQNNSRRQILRHSKWSPSTATGCTLARTASTKLASLTTTTKELWRTSGKCLGVNLFH